MGEKLHSSLLGQGSFKSLFQVFLCPKSYLFTRVLFKQTDVSLSGFLQCNGKKLYRKQVILPISIQISCRNSLNMTKWMS